MEELPNSQHVLCAWVCGREATDMELCSDEEVVETMTMVLRRFTGDPTLPYPSNILRSKWCMDQRFAGAYSYMGMDSTVGHQCDLASPLPGTANFRLRKLVYVANRSIVLNPTYRGLVYGFQFMKINEHRILMITVWCRACWTFVDSIYREIAFSPGFNFKKSTVNIRQLLTIGVSKA